MTPLFENLKKNKNIDVGLKAVLIMVVVWIVAPVIWPILQSITALLGTIVVLALLFGIVLGAAYLLGYGINSSKDWINTQKGEEPCTSSPAKSDDTKPQGPST